MNYRDDLYEILDFINCADTITPKDDDYINCVERFTKYTEEEYLDKRAEALLFEMSSSLELKNAFKKLSGYCKSDSDCAECPVNKYCNSYILNKLEAVKDDDLKMIDLFCGAGGLSLGFSQEGFVTALANDIESCCIDTYAHNHPETERKYIVQGDIREIVDHLMKYRLPFV